MHHRERGFLSRPDRWNDRAPLLRSQVHSAPVARIGATSKRQRGLAPSDESIALSEGSIEDESSEFNCWSFSACLMTCCIFPFCLSLAGKRDKLVQQAWREKVALCFLILFISLIVTFLTFGLRTSFCPQASLYNSSVSFFNNYNQIPYRDGVIVAGSLYDFNKTRALLSKINIDLTSDWHGQDISMLFSKTLNKACVQFDPNLALDCIVPNKFPQSPPLKAPSTMTCPTLDFLTEPPVAKLFFTWKDVQSVNTPHQLIVFNGAVLNITKFLNSSSTKYQNTLNSRLGHDATMALSSDSEMQLLSQCLLGSSTVGFIDRQGPGCVAAEVIVTFCTIVVMSVVSIRLIMALIFHWFLSDRLCRATGTRSVKFKSSSSTLVGKSLVEMLPNTILMVTCYSEGEQAIKSTLESLAATEYPDRHKLLFVVADGIIKGSGNEYSTPDIILSMLEYDPSLLDLTAKSYLAIANGSNQHNMAQVHAGYFRYMNRRIPMVVIVKCGSPSEKDSPKPGNRGKRDSQIILMNFLSRVLFNDRMTPLDYDLYKKMTKVTGGITPDKYDYVLMVDADTVVQHDSLGLMLQAMQNDEKIMGLCGETRIQNKSTSWVTMIQVFEYYISHHLGKAFESVYAAVTCLPGCFSMYRIKSYKGHNNKYLVPLLANPDIVDEYSENIVDTLHKKNLLLLGEDRFLTTLMLRTFPKRKIVFVPQAVCRTTVPDNFRILLSQRRRWINSTIHNLFELVKLRDLCGIFCFSMQFIVGLDLIGTIVLPAAISSVIYIIGNMIFTGQMDSLPLILLLFALVFPGLVIILATRKLKYIGWMLAYFLALPIWNFVLPLYAFWHFDDFSWGETRKVEGEMVHVDHSRKNGKYKVGAVNLRLLRDWERHEKHKLRAHKRQVVSSNSAGSYSDYTSDATNSQKRASSQRNSQYFAYPLPTMSQEQQRLSKPPTMRGLETWNPLQILPSSLTTSPLRQSTTIQQSSTQSPTKSVSFKPLVDKELPPVPVPAPAPNSGAKSTVDVNPDASFVIPVESSSEQLLDWDISEIRDRSRSSSVGTIVSNESDDDFDSISVSFHSVSEGPSYLFNQNAKNSLRGPRKMPSFLDRK